MTVATEPLPIHRPATVAESASDALEARLADWLAAVAQEAIAPPLPPDGFEEPI